MFLVIGVAGIFLGLGVLIGHRRATRKHAEDDAAAFASIAALRVDVAHLPHLAEAGS